LNSPFQVIGSNPSNLSRLSGKYHSLTNKNKVQANFRHTIDFAQHSDEFTSSEEKDADFEVGAWASTTTRSKF
jgi:hypothetical protein